MNTNHFKTEAEWLAWYARADTRRARPPLETKSVERGGVVVTAPMLLEQFGAYDTMIKAHLERRIALLEKRLADLEGRGR